MGFRLTIMEIVIRAGLHFSGAIIERGEGEEVAQMRMAWDFLKDWNLRGVPHAKDQNRIVLVVEEQTNARVTATRSEILAFGVGYEAATRIYQIPANQWETSEGLSTHDLQAFNAQGSLIRVELRGRLNRQHLGSAVSQVHDKFAQGDFNNAAGIIFFPRTTNAARTADMLILDPLGTREPEPQTARFRILLRHYAPFFYYQGGIVRHFGERMRALSLGPEQDLQLYLKHGDEELSGSSFKAGRVGFDWAGVRYVGTVWEDMHWPEWLVGIGVPGGGAFFWGIRKDIIEALRSGDLQHVADIDDEQEVFKTDRGIVAVLSDGMVLIWAPSADELILDV
jgi:hypothetical protein